VADRRDACGAISKPSTLGHLLQGDLLCEPWTPAFGLLGLTGFFEVTIASYEERIELSRISS
jgi:hypothetical protein